MTTSASWPFSFTNLSPHTPCNGFAFHTGSQNHSWPMRAAFGSSLKDNVVRNGRRP
jgi:hypothetical protein